MIYKHRYFKIDTESRKVWDENDKELSLTGKGYEILVFLCENEKATVDEVGDFLYGDSEKLYDYGTIRQHPYKANKIISHNVIQYKNSFFSIDGKVEKFESNQIVKEEKYSKTDNGKKDEKIKNTAPNNQKRKFALFIVGIVFVVCAFYIFLIRKNHDGKSSGVAADISKSKISNPQSEMVLIPTGDFLMGSTEEQALDAWKSNDGNYEKFDYLAEYPQRKINLPDFYIDKKEVSNADYKLFVDATNEKSLEIWNDQNLNAPTQPVVSIDWDEANAYCKWLGKRLPTEAEWEKAARGIDGRIWPWGNSWDLKKDNHGNGSEYGYDESDGFKYTAPVGTELGISPYGVLNMAGNVYEWTSDDLNAYPGNDKYIQNDFNKGYKVIKGGAYTDGQSEHRAASRIGYPRDFRENDFGFRCAKDKS